MHLRVMKEVITGSEIELEILLEPPRKIFLLLQMVPTQRGQACSTGTCLSGGVPYILLWVRKTKESIPDL